MKPTPAYLMLNIIGYTAATIIFTSIIVLTSYRDTFAPVKYDCALLIGRWHPDFPPDVIEACRKKGIKYDSSKTRY